MVRTLGETTLTLFSEGQHSLAARDTLQGSRQGLPGPSRTLRAPGGPPRQLFEKGDVLSFEDCVELAKTKLKHFIQSSITFECTELERCSLRRLLADLKGFNNLTNFLMIC